MSRPELEAALKLGLDPDKLARGAILGSVEIVDCVQNSKSKWAIPGRWHWIIKNPRKFAKPIPCKGALGFFRPEAPVMSKLSF